MSKYCGKCKTLKENESFYKLSTSKDKMQNWCKVCMDISNKANKEKRLIEGPSIIRDAKVCCDCNTRKPINQFHVKRGYSADGYGSYCRPCWLKRTVKNQKNAQAKKAIQ